MRVLNGSLQVSETVFEKIAEAVFRAAEAEGVKVEVFKTK